ncbi:MAG: right-handed parallel beta-helix repeat-containing protein [Lysobacter sp.]|nr:right-handed parallel beta-helix repeat-containing protein [Lysobacter sp.]
MTITRRALLRAASVVPVIGSLSLATVARAAVASGVSVRGFGAGGNGQGDDTDAFQRAIDSFGAAGGTVTVPAGQYLIDPLRGVHLRSRVHLQLDPNATLQAIANAADRAVMIVVTDVSDVTISGGNFIGERDQHMGTTGEWGHGIQLRGASRVVLRDLRVSRFWGDGLSVAATKPGRGDPVARPSTDVLLQRCVSIGNRRQGLTIGYAANVRVIDCEFSGTGGTAPEAGIDVEPDAGPPARDIEIAGCRLHGNHGPGIQVWKRTQGVRIHDCDFDDNRYGVLVVGGQDTDIANNHIVRSAMNGVAVKGGAMGAAIHGNQFSDNARRGGAARLSLPGGPPERHIHVDADVQGVQIGADNQFN